MNEIDILKWGAGACINLPSFPGINDDRILYLLGIDEERLLDLIGYHRLAACFLQRFEQEKPGWCTTMLLTQLLEQNAHAQRRTRRHIEAMRELTAALPEEYPPLIVKGFSSYALTGDPGAIRFSSDLDIFYPDPDRLSHTLRRLGYTTDASGLAIHEYDNSSCHLAVSA